MANFPTQGDKYVLVSEELLEVLTGDWSKPVQVKVVAVGNDGRLTLVFRNPEPANG